MIKQRITLGLKPDWFEFLPGDVICINGREFDVIGVGFDSSGYYLDLNITEYQVPEGNIDFVLTKSTEHARPWYSEICETCMTTDSCSLCQKALGWSRKKFVWLGDKIRWLGEDLTVSYITQDDKKKFIVKTNKYDDLYLDDPEIEIIERSEPYCKRPDLLDWKFRCTFCVNQGACQDCFLPGLIDRP